MVIYFTCQRDKTKNSNKKTTRQVTKTENKLTNVPSLGRSRHKVKMALDGGVCTRSK